MGTWGLHFCIQKVIGRSMTGLHGLSGTNHFVRKISRLREAPKNCSLFDAIFLSYSSNPIGNYETSIEPWGSPAISFVPAISHCASLSADLLCALKQTRTYEKAMFLCLHSWCHWAMLVEVPYCNWLAAEGMLGQKRSWNNLSSQFTVQTFPCQILWIVWWALSSVHTQT